MNIPIQTIRPLYKSLYSKLYKSFYSKENNSIKESNKKKSWRNRILSLKRSLPQTKRKDTPVISEPTGIYKSRYKRWVISILLGTQTQGASMSTCVWNSGRQHPSHLKGALPSRTGTPFIHMAYTRQLVLHTHLAMGLLSLLFPLSKAVSFSPTVKSQIQKQKVL